MNSVIAFLMTFLQLAVAAGAFFLQAPIVFMNVVVYGSPFYLAMNLFKSGSALTDASPLFIGFILYHVIKYFFFFRAQMVDDSNGLRTMAIIFESIYLCLSAYYIY
jgi:hypothetical protein